MLLIKHANIFTDVSFFYTMNANDLAMRSAGFWNIYFSLYYLISLLALSFYFELSPALRIAFVSICFNSFDVGIFPFKFSGNL